MYQPESSDAVGGREDDVVVVEVVIGRRGGELQVHRARARARNETGERKRQPDRDPEQEHDQKSENDSSPAFSFRHCLFFR